MEANNWGKWSVYVALVFFVIFQICANLTLKMTSNQYNSNMAFFQTQFMNGIYVILGIVMMIPMIIIGNKNYESKWGIPAKHRNWKNHITYFSTGILDAWACYAMGISGNNVAGAQQTILQQLTFPLSVIISPFVFEKTKKQLKICFVNNPKYMFLYVVGTILLILGIIIGVISDLTKNNSSNITDLLIFISAPIVSTISWLLKEKLFGPNKDNASAVHLNVMNAVYMVPITFVYLPLQTLQLFGGIPIDTLMQTTLVDGWKCFINTYPNCSGAWWPEVLYAISTFGAGVCAVVLCKQASASFQWASNILAVPLSCLFFTIPNLPANSSEKMSKDIIIGLVIVVVGMIMYVKAESYIGDIKIIDEDEYDETTHLGVNFV